MPSKQFGSLVNIEFRLEMLSTSSTSSIHHLGDHTKVRVRDVIVVGCSFAILLVILLPSLLISNKLVKDNYGTENTLAASTKY